MSKNDDTANLFAVSSIKSRNILLYLFLLFARRKVMSKFEILCVTMNQSDFSKINEMNISADVVFANQGDCTSYKECKFDNHIAKMISTETRGVGINRNIALSYATADICLLADDDVVYLDNARDIIISEFEKNKDADVIVFYLESNDPSHRQLQYSSTRKHRKFERMPWGAIRIAFRLNSIKKSNVWFTALFGGGCIFPSGEDSIWLHDLKKQGLTFYVSKEKIGEVSFDKSTWFSGYDEKFYYGKGAYYQAVYPKMAWLWKLYFVFRTSKFGELSFLSKMEWMKKGQIGYKKLISYSNFK